MTHPFITHNGGPCPVSPETRVDVRFADDFAMNNVEAGIFSSDDDYPWDAWTGVKCRHSQKIIAYRLHQPDKGEAS